MKEEILSLELPPDRRFLSSVTGAAESMALAQGLSAKESYRLVLACDEFFSYLCKVAVKDRPMRVSLKGRGFSVGLEFAFFATKLDLSALNFNAVSSLDDESGEGHELGLLLASRVAERCGLEMRGADSFLLTAEVDKIYAKYQASPLPLGTGEATRPGSADDPDSLRHAVILALSNYPAWNLPAAFASPERYADMSLAGVFRNVIMLDAASKPVGLLSWRGSGERGLQFSGPFVLSSHGRERTAKLLMESFLEIVGREKATGVFSERCTAETPPGYFETLGELDYSGSCGNFSYPVVFRMLREDSGATVWADDQLKPFLRSNYERLSLMREILPLDKPGGSFGASLVSTSLSRSKSLAQLTPLLGGEDLQANLISHASLLREKGYSNILFNLDLGQAWQAGLHPAVAGAGFVPRLVLPGAGRSDIVVFQHARN